MDILKTVDIKAEELKAKVLSAADLTPDVGARVYYFAAAGDDSNDGLTPATPFKTLEKASSLADKENKELTYFLFNRGDTFRGQLNCGSNCVYAAYGKGDKPIITASPENGADPAKWRLVEGSDNIWVYYKDMIDVGALFFENGGYAVKRIPNIENGKYEFGMEILEDGQFMNGYNEEQALRLNNSTAKEIKGPLYFRCDKGNPGEVYASIEFAARIYCVNLPYYGENITVDNLCVANVGAHGVGGGFITDLLVQNCEIGNIGGGIQSYHKWSVDGLMIYGRYGNGVELHSCCNGYVVRNCWVHDVYDAGLTWQQGHNHSDELVMGNIEFSDNLIERCIYSIEYFARRSASTNVPAVNENIRLSGNIVRYAGHGFGTQRTLSYYEWNMATSIMGWHWSHNVRRGYFVIENNILSHSTPSSPDRPLRQNTSTLLITAEDKKYLPEMKGNTYIGLKDNQFAYYGENIKSGPVPFVKAEDGLSAEELFGDKTGKIFMVEK